MLLQMPIIKPKNDDRKRDMERFQGLGYFLEYGSKASDEPRKGQDRDATHPEHEFDGLSLGI